MEIIKSLPFSDYSFFFFFTVTGDDGVNCSWLPSGDTEKTKSFSWTVSDRYRYVVFNLDVLYSIYAFFPQMNQHFKVDWIENSRILFEPHNQQ